METEAVLQHVVETLIASGYEGLLLILDEVSLFMKNRTEDQRVEDEKTLVVLSNRLAKTHWSARLDDLLGAAGSRVQDGREEHHRQRPPAERLPAPERVELLRHRAVASPHRHASPRRSTTISRITARASPGPTPSAARPSGGSSPSTSPPSTCCVPSATTSRRFGPPFISCTKPSRPREKPSPTS